VWQAGLMISSNGQAGCVDFTGVQILYPRCDFLLIFRADSLVCSKLSLGLGDYNLFLVIIFIYFPFD